MEAHFSNNNVTKLLVVLMVYGFRVSHVASANSTILNPNVRENEVYQYHKFWVGWRLKNDEEVLYTTKRSPVTLDRTIHTILFDLEIEYFITYIEIAVNVSQLVSFQ